MPIYLKNEAHLVGEMPNLIMLIQVILDLIKTVKAPADLQLSLKPIGINGKIQHRFHLKR